MGMVLFFHLVFPQNFFEMNQFTTNSSFQVSENFRYTLYSINKKDQSLKDPKYIFQSAPKC